MKLLISLTDQSFAATKSVGIFNVSMGLTRGLMSCGEVSELHILGNQECADSFGDRPSHVYFHLLDKPVPRRFGRIFWDQWGVSRAIRAIRPDWAILPKGFPPFFPCIGSTRLACYVHDVNWEYYRHLHGGDSPFPPTSCSISARWDSVLCGFPTWSLPPPFSTATALLPTFPRPALLSWV